MVYLEHSNSKFWRCEVQDVNVHTSYGKVNTDGRSMTKSFDTEDEAQKHAAKTEASKRKGKYVDAVDPSVTASPPPVISTPKKRKAASAVAVTPSPTVSKKAGLGGFSAPDAVDGNVLDSGVAGIDAALASRAQVHDTLHARLALVDTAINSDKYYILQVLTDETVNPPKRQKGRGKKKATTTGGPQYYLFTRWGRTGTGGQCKLEGPFEKEDEAKTVFSKTFKSKTAVEWNVAVAGSAPKRGKYEYLATNTDKASSGQEQWYYFLQNDPMGKPDGWYEYDETNSTEVEDLHGTYLASKKAQRLAQRVVTSETSGYQYRVDLSTMHQTNTSSGTSRPIGRTDNGKPPTSIPATPTRPPVSVAPVAIKKMVVSNVTSAPAPSVKTKLAGTVDSAASPKLQQQGSIHEDYDVMMNQTNIGANNNKFYKIQLIQTSAGFTLFTKWGRVGEAGKTQEQGPFGDIDKAHKEFAKKFKAKTANSWENYQEDKNTFTSKKGKYTVVEMEQDESAASAMATAVSSNKPVAKSDLDPVTKRLVDLLFDEDMFKSAMTAMNLDPKKLPLGALSQAQIAKGFSVLEQLEDAINNNANSTRLEDITSDFYTLIPHAFGRSRGPVLNTIDKVKQKYEMLNTLTDIEAAQSMQKTMRKGGNDDEEEEAQPNPSDLNYEQLAADLSLLHAMKDKDFQLVKSYFDHTKASNGCGGNMKLRHVWRVNRHKEEQRFAKHASIDDRKLLWHGTNVAVVAAILKSGLRIMPHSGGRVGRGIYLADQHQKSAWYTRSARGTTIMFLVEAALGTSHEITRDDPSLTAAPAGCSSVLAKGRMAPPNSKDLNLDGKTVGVPQGKPQSVAGASNSSFEHNEFLIYSESQHRIRYILTFDSN